MISKPRVAKTCLHVFMTEVQNQNDEVISFQKNGKNNVKSPSLGGILQVQLKNLIKYIFVAFYLKTPIHFLNLKLFVAIGRSLNIVAQREKTIFCLITMLSFSYASMNVLSFENGSQNQSIKMS